MQQLGYLDEQVNTKPLTLFIENKLNKKKPIKDTVVQAEVGQALIFRPSCYAIELLSILLGYFSVFFACIPIIRNSLINSLS